MKPGTEDGAGIFRSTGTGENQGSVCPLKKFDISVPFPYGDRYSGNEARSTQDHRFAYPGHEGLGACRRRVFVAFLFWFPL